MVRPRQRARARAAPLLRELLVRWLEPVARQRALEQGSPEVLVRVSVAQQPLAPVAWRVQARVEQRAPALAVAKAAEQARAVRAAQAAALVAAVAALVARPPFG